MRRVLRFIFRSLIGVVALVGVLGALLGYYGYSPAPEVPRLSGTLTRGTMTVGGLKRLQNRPPESGRQHAAAFSSSHSVDKKWHLAEWTGPARVGPLYDKAVYLPLGSCRGVAR